jgi:type I restriction enzyme M protein
LSPTRKSRSVKCPPHQHTGEADEYRAIAEIVEELNALEEEAKVTDAALKAILKRIGI